MHPIRVPAITLPLLAILAGACDKGLPEPVDHDLAEIRSADTLRVLTMYNSTSYFLYRGDPMGYEYELIQDFAEENDLAVHTVVVRDRSELFERLNAGDGDIVAARLLRSEVDTTRVAVTAPLYTTAPTVVQLAGPPSEAGLPKAVDTILATRPARADSIDVIDPGEPGVGAEVDVPARLINRPAQLAGEEVHLAENSEYGPVLLELEETLSGDIHVVEVENSPSVEGMIRRVARGEFRLTIAPENVARLKESYFTNVAVLPTIGEENHIVLAVRENAPELQRALDAFIAEAEQAGELNALYQKYFVDRAGYEERATSTYLTSETGRLSEYDELIRDAAATLDWDWRLLASQAFQESRFDAQARSWAGAMGLLQLMPGTARDMDVANPNDPEQNVAGAVRYLQFLEEMWQTAIPDTTERLRFVLASYNAGFGHVQDAQRLAEKHGQDPTSWEDVAYWMLQLSKKQYYRDPVVEYGFVRGLEPVTYVALILERFAHYKEFVQA